MRVSTVSAVNRALSDRPGFPIEPALTVDRIVHGDCVKVLRELPSASVDFVLTDPPYLVNYRDDEGRSIANDVGANWLAPAFGEVGRVLRPDSFCVSFYGWPKVELFMAAWKAAGLRPVGHLVWTKGYASKRGYLACQHEVAYLLAKGRPRYPKNPPPDVQPWHYTGNRLHPNEKPVAALAPLIEALSEPGALVLDPFCGSGATAVAAVQTSRHYFGIELEWRHWRTATNRLERYRSRPPTDGTPGSSRST